MPFLFLYLLLNFNNVPANMEINSPHTPYTVVADTMWILLIIVHASMCFIFHALSFSTSALELGIFALHNFR